MADKDGNAHVIRGVNADGSAFLCDWNGTQLLALDKANELRRELASAYPEVTYHVMSLAVVESSEHDAWLAQARYLGADAALAAASWLTMSEADARSILDDVDPEVMDRYPAPNLSGEFADDPTPDSLTLEITGLSSWQHERDEPAQEIADAWEEGRDSVWDDALQAHALRLLGEVQRALEVERTNEAWVDTLRHQAEL